MVLCESLHFFPYAWCSYFPFFLSYVNITELLKFKMNAKRPFWNRLLPEVNQADIAVYICQIKRSAGHFFLKRANEHFFVSGPSNQRVHYMGIKMSSNISRCYVMAMWSMRKQKLIDQSSCKIFEIIRKTIENGRPAAILYFTSAKFVIS